MKNILILVLQDLSIEMAVTFSEMATKTAVSKMRTVKKPIAPQGLVSVARQIALSGLSSILKLIGMRKEDQVLNQSAVKP